jgi:Tol biopolymer transport system component
MRKTKFHVEMRFLSRPGHIILLALLALSTAVGGRVYAQDFANIEYLCCDWGPAMKLSGKTNEPPVFSKTDEEVYFLKQTGRFTRSPRGDKGHGTNIYLCKMKPDGSEKTEIRELWHNVTYPIDTQGQTTWMDVNEKTKRIALCIGFAGTDLIGLWVLNMDGTGLTRIVSERTEEKRLRAINKCSWSPDGQWIMFEEELRGTKPDNFHNIARCDTTGGQVRRLLLGGEKEHYRQPSVSPDGQSIAFVKYPNGYPGERWIWLMTIDGTEAHPLGGKQSLSTWGTWPTWSPDGKSIFAVGMAHFIVDLEGKKLIAGTPELNGKRCGSGWAHWGKTGFVGFKVGGILFTDLDLKEARALATSRVSDSSREEIRACDW